jgi:hypothetical protein
MQHRIDFLSQTLITDLFISEVHSNNEYLEDLDLISYVIVDL